MTNRDAVTLFYDYLKSEIPAIPPLFFPIGQEANLGFIITPENTSQLYYDEDILQFSWAIRLYFPKVNHELQFTTMEKIIQTITSDNFKKLNFDNYLMYNMSINDNFYPLSNSVLIDLESYDEVYQSYFIKITLYLKEKRKN